MMKHENHNIGLLHSFTGTMAASEAPLLNAELMAIEEINKTGGLLNKKIEAIIEDGESNTDTFVKKALLLIEKYNVKHIFGCWTSASRKALKPLVEKYNVLLWYPIQYEGLEESPNIIYTGPCLNQQILPSVQWCIENLGNRFFLIGTDYIFPWIANKFIKAQLKNSGTVVDEQYYPLGAQEFHKALEAIKSRKPDVIFNTINGDSNQAFFKEFSEACINASECPIFSVSLSEQDILNYKELVAGHYACWSYFESLENTKNREFIDNYKKMYGSNQKSSDSIVTAYSQIYLWKQAVEKAHSFDINIKDHVHGIQLDSPKGKIEIQSNNHTLLDYYIGKALPDGQFEIIAQSESPIEPMPWLGAEKLEGSSGILREALDDFKNTIDYNAILNHQSLLLKDTIKELKHSDLWLKGIFNALEEAVLVVTPDRILQHVNPAAIKMFGYSEAELRKLSTEVLHVDKDHYIEFGKRIQSAFEQGKSAHFEFEAKRKNGEIFPSEHRVSLLKDDQGRTFGIVSVVIDISERKQLEMEQQEIKNDLIKAQAISKVGSWKWDLQTNKVEWSDEMFKIFGIQQEQFDGVLLKAIELAVHPEDKEKVIKANELVLKNHLALPVEYRLVMKNGEVKYVHGQGEFQYDRNGNPECLIGTIHDISEYKRIQDELRFAKLQLEDIVEERTQDLENAYLELQAANEELDATNEELFTTNEELEVTNLELEQANKRLEIALENEKELSDLKKEFTANVNHELRTPLTSILMTTQYLLKRIERLDKENIESRLKRIDYSAKNLLQLVNEILDFARIEDKRLTCKIEEISIDLLFKELEKEYQYLFETKGLHFISIKSNLTIENDFNHLLKILGNLLSNAQKFTEKGYVKLYTKLVDDKIHFIVQDTGRGIEKEDFNRIFERYQQLDHIDNKSPGTGIGLHMVKKLTQKHGGEVLLESTMNVGSTFTIILPIKSKWWDNVKKKESET